MGEELISIVIPIYNTADYLGQCIESVQKQTYRNIEIILVDDGSTDGSGEICDRYAQGDPRIKVIHKANGGNTSARKAGIEASAGEYIGFVDSDDWIEPVMYERLMEEARANSADMVVLQKMFFEYGDHSNVFSYATKGGVYNTYETRRKLLSRLFYDGSYDVYAISGNLCSVLFREKLLKRYYNAVPDGIQLGEDTVLVYTCVVNARSVCLLEESYYHYRRHAGSITHSVKRDILLNEHLSYKYFRNLFENSEFSELLIKQLDIWIVNHALSKINYQMGLQQGISIPMYMFPWESMRSGDRVVLYGAGSVGKSYRRQLESAGNVKLAAWVDADAEKYIEKGFDVENAESILRHDYDRIVIAVKSADLADVIKDELVGMGIEEGKILWEKPKSVLEYFLPYDKYYA